MQTICPVRGAKDMGTNFFQVGNIAFGVQIIIAELLFLYGCPKRSHFLLRLFSAVGISILLFYFFPMPHEIAYKVYYSILRFLVLFTYTVIAMACCFNINKFALLSLCLAGYAVQHASYHVENIFLSMPFIDRAYLQGFGYYYYLFELGMFFPVYALGWWFFGRTVKKDLVYRRYNVSLNAIAFCIVLICVGFTRVARNESHGVMPVSTSLYSILCCGLALILQFEIYKLLNLEAENKAIRNLRESDKRQYEIAKSTIETINIKCHDLKHKLYAYNEKFSETEMEEIKSSLRMYDNTIHTGNEVLDVVLMDNALRYNATGISFTFTGNGEYLSFMDESDLASLFGNAISNAAEAVSKVLEKDKRTIGVVLEKHGDMVTVNVRNYYNGELNLQDGLPVTTKRENVLDHGYGLKSIRRTAENYDGNVKILTDGDVFILNVYMLANR